jgi:glycerol-3-phosphate dehydrogenase
MTEAGSNSPTYDLAVIGGGVVGCAIARRFSLAGAHVVLIEKGADILSGASKANSAILHTGFDAPPGSLELACIQAGHAEYCAVASRMNLPLDESGALLVAWTEDDLAQLDPIVAQAHANGVMDVQRVTAEEVRAREPALSSALLGGVYVPREFLIDPWSAPLAYLHQAIAHGAEVRRGCEVTGGAFDGQGWKIETTGGRVLARHVINCAGLQGDRLETLLLGDARFEIRPRKGQFVVFDKAAARLLHAILLPVPSERTKGIVITRTVFGNLLVGPTAEEQEDRLRAEVDTETLRLLKAAAIARIPALADLPVTALYAGLRPATRQKHYHIRQERERHWISVGGIRSTGLSAALGLAQHVFGLWDGGAGLTPPAHIHWPRLPNLAEDRPRDWQEPDHGEIVCHCEMVTRREIEATFQTVLPPGDFGGLKRRTRACMGRCQGFYCTARLAELTEGRLAAPLAVGRTHGA